MSYVESDQYQKEIKEQYAKRISSFSKEEVVRVVKSLGYSISCDEIHEAEIGNVNATYITEEYVIKVIKEKTRGYIANTLVSDSFPFDPVVRVLAHDMFNVTPYEVLIMKRSPGVVLQKDILELDESTIKELFSQVIDVVVKCSTLTSETFGLVNSPDQRSASFRDLQKSKVDSYVQVILEAKLADEKSIVRIQNYFDTHAHVLENEHAVLVHNDLHMGNILHSGNTLTAIIDWDSAYYAPLYTVLHTILGFIDNPSQFVEGTVDYEKFKGVRFSYLIPILKERLPDIFKDENLILKLNLFGIVEGLMWVSQNWSTEWNREMIQKLVEEETPDDIGLLKNSYYGRVLS